MADEEVEGPLEPIPGEQPSGEPQPMPMLHGTYLSRNAGRRQSLLEAAAKLVNTDDLDDAKNEIGDEVHNLGQVVADYGDILDRKVEPWAVPTVAPLSSTINRRADPTFQLSDFMVPNLPLAGTTVGASGHFHELTSPSIGDPGRVERGLASGAAVTNRVHFAFITPAINRAYEQLNFMVGAVTNPCNMNVAIYVVDENRQLNRQVGPIQVSDSIGLGESLVTVPFPRFVATQGSYIAIAWLQTGGGNPRALLGLNDTPRPLTNVVFPRKISARGTSTSATSLYDTFDGTSYLNFDWWFTPYAELSENIGIDYRVFNEPWAYTGLIGRPWLALTSPGVYSNADLRAVAASGFGTRVSMYDTPLSTDFARIRTRVHSVFTNNQRRTTIIFRGTNDLRSGVGLSVINGSRYELIQWSGQNADRNWDTGNTVIRTVNIVPNDGHNLEIDYLDGYVTFRINGIEQFADQLVGGPTGAAGRFLGIQNERGGNVFVAWPSPFLGPWSARDLPQDEDGGDGDIGEGTG